jgi:signal recognition particle subunit SRP54
MFDDLQKRLSSAFGRFRARGILTEANIKDGLREVRTALLEADVNFQVVQEFMQRVGDRAVGTQLIKSVRPEQQIVKIVHDELVELMGPVDPSIRFEKTGPTILMLCGLQGSGKTTTCGKLARLLASQGRKPLLVAADLQRPAAVEQLKVIGQQLDVPVFSATDSSPIQVCQDAVVEANRQGRDTVLLDTAGRLHVDDELMAELTRIEKKVKPHQVFFVCDALTGQDAVASAGAFNQALELDGVIMTKLDGDARGGAALSVKAITGMPILFASTGEKLDAFERFHPDRMAQRILGMGDVLTFVEKAQREVDEDQAAEMERKLRKAEFTFDDFLDQLKTIRRMGPIGNLIGMLPGAGAQLKGMKVDERELDRVEAIVLSMTPEERRRPELIKGSRRLRIAKGSGTTVQAVNQLVKQFDQMRKLMKSMSRGKMPDLGALMRQAR